MEIFEAERQLGYKSALRTSREREREVTGNGYALDIGLLQTALFRTGEPALMCQRSEIYEA